MDTVLALQAGGQIPAVGIVDDIMAELQVKAVARAVPVGNEEGGGFPEFLQVTEPFFHRKGTVKARHVFRAVFSGKDFTQHIDFIGIVAENDVFIPVVKYGKQALQPGVIRRLRKKGRGYDMLG